MISNEDEFYAEKARLQVETAAANKRVEEAQKQTQQLKLDTQLQAVYREAGGIISDDDSAAYEAIKNHLKSRIEFENGQPVFLDADGLVELGNNGPKTLAEKMAELKQNSTLKGFFSDNDSSSQEGNSQQGSQPQTYTREQARNGKASIDDIASGKLKLEGVDEMPKPATKVVSASLLANLKSRNWK